jgi:uncharacterized protein (DUF1697 family)
VPRYAAFLRAINVGGHVVKMDRLRTICAGMGLDNIETFIASGNVVFDCSTASAGALEESMEKQLKDALGYAVSTFVRTMPELAAIATHEPFDSDDGILYVGLLKKRPGAAAVRRVRALANDIDQLDVHGRELYWLIRKSFSESTVTGAGLEKIVGDATVRNISTIRRMAARWAGTARK